MSQLLGPTDVVSGNGVIATSQQGNLEYGQIDLRFAPGGGGAINRGGNYTLRAGNGQSWATVCLLHDGDQVSFKVM